MKRVALALGVLLLAACGDETRAGSSEPVASASPTKAELYAEATVLESQEHGPQLCLGGVADSLPPQCGGPDVVGWDWERVGAFERHRGTTWGDYVVIGRYDPVRDAFTPTRPAVPFDEYDGPRPHAAERPSKPPEVRLGQAELEALQVELFDRTDAVFASSERGQVLLTVVHDDGTLQARLDEEYGDGVVVVTSALQRYPG